MRVVVRGWAHVVPGIVCAALPGEAHAAETGATELTVAFAVVGAVLAAVGFGAALFFRRRAMDAEAEAARCNATIATERAVAAAHNEQFIRWSVANGAETASAGLVNLIGGGDGVEAPSAMLRAVLSEADAEFFDKAVAGLRANGTPFEHSFTSAEPARSFHLSGRRAVADGGDPVADLVFVRDHTELAAKIKALAGEVGTLRRLLDMLPVPIWMRGDDLSFKYVNRAYHQAVEIEATSPPDDMPEIAAGAVSSQGRALAEAAREDKAVHSERHHIVMGGSRRLVELSETPLDGTDVIGGFALDHTEVEEIESELSRHIAGHQEVLQNLGTAVTIYGADQSLQFYNIAFIRLWGLDEAWLGTGPRMGEVLEELRERRRLPEYADFPAFKNEQLKLFTSLIEPLEELVHLPDGTTLRSVMTPHPFGGLILTWEDVTDALAMERSYNTLIAVQSETLDNLYEGVAVIGSNGRLQLSNPAFARMWQIPADVLAGEPHVADIVERMRDLLGDSDDWPAEKQRIIGFLTDREPRSSRIERVDGSVLDYATVPLPDGAVLLSYFDVSASIQMERALRERNEALETADRLKSEFIANVSYELRTPLNTIIGFTEILTGQYFGELNERQAEYSHGILDSSNRLLLLINDILDLATIEAGHMTLELDSIDVYALLNGSLGLIRERARQKKLSIECDCAEDFGAIIADERRLKQALFNILSNAVKFTPDNGSITLSARRRNGEVVFTTADSGIGIQQEDQHRVFGKFERGSNPEARRSGPGLGLSLVKSFFELHGGHVEIESAPNAGTRVICSLPAQASGSPPALDAEGR